MKTKVTKVFAAHASFMSFILGVTLLASLTFSEVPCPVSKGTGVISGAQGLKVTGIETELTDHVFLNLECGWDFERYTYAVKISVVNETATPIYGAIVVNFHNPTGAFAEELVEVEGITALEGAYAGPIEAAILVYVEVAAETAQTIEETFVFDGIGLEELEAESHTVTVTTTGEFDCPYDGGTGKVTITEWLRLI
jgi:hypothetical protein